MNTFKITLAFVLGAFIAGAQPFPQTGNSPTRTTLSAALAAPVNGQVNQFVSVASTTGCPASGTFNNVSNPCDLFVGREQMHILAINGTLLTVERGANGTLAEAYPSGTAAFIGSASVFRNTPFPQFGDWNVNNTYTFWSTFSPPADPAPTQTTDVSGKLWYTAIQIPNSQILTGACMLNGSGALADKMILALWDRNGNLLANSALAGVTQSGTSIYQCQNFVNPVITQGPNLYFVGVQGNGATAASIATISAGAAPTNYPTGVQTGGTFGTILNITSPSTSFTAAIGPEMIVF